MRSSRPTMSFSWSWNTAQVVSSSISLLTVRDSLNNRLANYTCSWSPVLSTFTRTECAIVIWNPKICFLITTIALRSLILGSATFMKKDSSWKRHVARHVTPLLKWLRESRMIASNRTSGAQVSCSTQWSAVIFLLRTKTRLYWRIKSSRANLIFQLTSLMSAQILWKESWIQIRPNATP